MLKEKTFLFVLGILFFTFIYAVNPQAVRAEGTHEGKFSAAVNSRATIYNNTTTAAQVVLVTVCVTSTGAQNAFIEHRDVDGILIEALAGLRFGQCRSLTVDIPVDHAIAVRAPSSVSAVGTYTVSVRLP
jgi:hypothetical protein